jgi:hypothetical protein
MDGKMHKTIEKTHNILLVSQTDFCRRNSLKNVGMSSEQ